MTTEERVPQCTPRTSGDLLERLAQCDVGTLRALVNRFMVPGRFLVKPYKSIADGVVIWASSAGCVKRLHEYLDEIGVA